jgi:hypothetical protein
VDYQCRAPRATVFGLEHRQGSDERGPLNGTKESWELNAQGRSSWKHLPTEPPQARLDEGLFAGPKFILHATRSPENSNFGRGSARLTLGTAGVIRPPRERGRAPPPSVFGLAYRGVEIVTVLGGGEGAGELTTKVVGAGAIGAAAGVMTLTWGVGAGGESVRVVVTLPS